MSDFEYGYLMTPVVDEIDDPVTPLSHPVAIGVTGEFLRALRPGTLNESLNSLDKPLTIRLRANRL